jgi:hypothetical protein
LLVKTFDEDDPNNLTTGLVAVDMATGQTRTVVTPQANQYLVVSGDRTAVAVCQSQEDGSGVLRLERVYDAAAEGRPYSSPSLSCQDLATDATGRRIVVQDTSLMLVDLGQGSKVSSIGGVPGATTSYAPDLISAGGKLLLASYNDAQIAYTELPTSPEIIDVSDQALTNDGSKVISLLKDGSLQLRPAGADSDHLLAQSPGPQPPWNPDDNHLRLSSDRSLVADREAANVVTIRDTSTLRQTAQVTTIMPPSPPQTGADNYFNYFFDQTGNLVTVSGAQVQQWDARTGRQLAHLDAAALLRAAGDVVSDTQDVEVGPYPAPNQIFVALDGDPDGDPVVRIVDVATGHTTTTLKTATDRISIQFDASGRYFALLRQAGVVELWQRDPLRRELGPLHSLYGITNQPFVAGFLDGNGRYLIAANDAIRIYQIGQQAPVDSYEFGHPDGSNQQSPYSFIDASKDGRTVLYADESGQGGPLALDPAAWERDLCRIIGNRDFTPDERASLPAPIPTQQVCPATG